MANAIERVYHLDKNGKYKLYSKKLRYEFPMTLGRWERDRIVSKNDYDIKIYKKLSGLSVVPYKVIVTSKDKKVKTIYTTLKNDKRLNKNVVICKNVNCKSRW